MKNLKTIVLIFSFIAFWLWIAFRVYLSYVQPPVHEVENLNNHIEFIVKKHNKLNHKYNLATDRIKEHEEANCELIKVCDPSQFRRAAKNTELPKMEV